MMIDTIRDPFTLVFFTAQSGATSARLDRDDGTSLHLHSLVDPECEGEYFSEVRFWGDRIILAGCGLGYHLKGAFAQGDDSAEILLVEFYEELAMRALESFPASLRGRVTVITAGEKCYHERMRTFLQGGRYVQIVKHPASFHAHDEFYRSVLNSVEASRTRANPPKAMLLLQGDFFAERELRFAAEENGTTVIPLFYKSENSMVGYESRLQKLIQTGRPDVVVSVNMLGFDGNEILSEHTLRSGIPVAVWFMDDPRPILLNRRKCVTSNMVAFSWERDYIPWLRQQGFDSVHYLPLATDPHRCLSDTTGLPSIRCGFVGSAMGGSFLNDIAAKFIWKKEYRMVAEEIANLILLNALDDIDQSIENACRARMVPLLENDGHTRTWLRSYIVHTASMLKRKRCISALMPLGVETFGDPDNWRELFGNGLITHPDIDYYTGITDYYRSITVNINITSCQMPSALNQRVFDVPAFGAFVLNDFQQDLNELFSENEYAAYHTPEELPDKVEFYLKNKQAREAVIVAARKRILNEHTYLHRLLSLLKLL